MQNKRSQQIFKNRLFLTSLINLLIFLTFIVAMAYYKWALISLPLYYINPAKAYAQRDYFQFYINLLYAKQINSPHYQTYSSLSRDLCLDNDIYCQSAFSQLAFIGYLTFAILALGASFQMYDIYSMIHYFMQERETDFSAEKKDNLRHVLTIGHFIVAITLNIFGLVMMDVDVTPSVSFWIFVAALLAFIVILVYEQLSLTKIHKQKLILELMEGEREITNNMGKIEQSVELSSEGDFSL
jgi:hypothetical protein